MNIKRFNGDFGNSTNNFMIDGYYFEIPTNVVEISEKEASETFVSPITESKDLLSAAIDDLELLISNNQYCGLCLYNGGATNCARVDGRCDAKWKKTVASSATSEEKQLKNNYVIKGNTVEIVLENSDRVALIDLDDLHKLHSILIPDIQYSKRRAIQTSRLRLSYI